MDRYMRRTDQPRVDAKKRRITRQCILIKIVAALLDEYGVTNAKISTLHILTEVLQNFIIRLGKFSAEFMEMAGRCKPVASDVFVALQCLNIDIAELKAYAWRPYRSIPDFPRPENLHGSIQHLRYPTSDMETEDRPDHIPWHLPPFPSLHSYCKTPCYMQVETSPMPLRLKKLEQRRCIQKAMINFEVRTNPDVFDLLTDEKRSSMSLLGCKPWHPIYRNALIPNDEFRLEYDASLKDDEDTSDIMDDGEEIISPYLCAPKLPTTKIILRRESDSE